MHLHEKNQILLNVLLNYLLLFNKYYNLNIFHF